MAILLMTRKTVTVQATYEIQYMMELWKDKIICLLHCKHCGLGTLGVYNGDV